MKKRYTGGLAVAIFALGFLLSQLWNFGGLGTGETDQPGEQSDATLEAPDLSTAAANGNLNVSMNSEASGTVETVTIAIHDDRYRLTTDADPSLGADISLAEVVRQVQQATGGEQGVRLRVLFAKDAQEGALADLHAALQEAQVKREEIQEISGYIEE